MCAFKQMVTSDFIAIVRNPTQKKSTLLWELITGIPSHLE